jgi:hypothetical protein
MKKCAEGILPRELPGQWKMLAKCADGAAYVRSDRLIVVSNIVQESSGDRWLHVSCSCETRPPTLVDLQEVKTIFAGAARMTFQVLPPALPGVSEPTCFHLWTALDDREFPKMLKKT